MCGNTCSVHAYAPRAFTPMTRSNFFMGESTMFFQCSAPALFTRMSMRPAACSASPTARSTAASSRTSSCTGCAFTPSSESSFAAE